MISVFRCGVPTSAAGCRPTVLAVRILAPGTIAHAVAGIIIIRCAAVPARTGASMLAGRILFPRAIAIVVSACIDGFALGLTAGAAITAISVAGASGRLLAL